MSGENSVLRSRYGHRVTSSSYAMFCMMLNSDAKKDLMHIMPSFRDREYILVTSNQGASAVQVHLYPFFFFLLPIWRSTLPFSL